MRPPRAFTRETLAGWAGVVGTLALGLLFSALTENQVIAAFLSMSVLFILWLGDYAGSVVQSRALAQVIRELSLQAHYATSFLVGVIRFEDAVFFIGVITAALFIATRALESRRWR